MDVQGESSMDDFDGKVAFITGGASGIGLGIATVLGSKGMKLVLADIEQAALDAAVAGFEAKGVPVTGVICDVSKKASVDAAADHAIATFGKIHVLCNNAGVSPSGVLEETTAGDWEWGIGVNLMGVVHGIQSIVPRIRAHGEGGHVVNTASIAGMVALPTLGIYAATKYAVVGISETLQGEVAAAGIGVSVLCPAFVRTKLADSGRNKPEDLGPSTGMADFVVQALNAGMEPEEVGEHVYNAIAANKLYIFTHGESKAGFEFRANSILDAFPDA
jgi:NAD(P)-dependent dehydrogenase (short-subunit alcohol dehydrogenase family)